MASTPTPLAPAWTVRSRRRDGVRLAPSDGLVVIVLAGACWSSYSPPTLVAGAMPSLWSLEPLASVSLMLLALALAAALGAARGLVVAARASVLDVPVAMALGAVLFLDGLALARHTPLRLYETFDVQAVVLFVLGYVVVSRLSLDLRRLTLLLHGMAVLLALHAAWLTIRYGVLGDTGFATTRGRIALLVTEDALLLVVPAVVAWGRVIDGLTSVRVRVATLVLLAAGAVIELLSLRRGALVFIVAALVARSLWARPRQIAGYGAALVLAAVVALSVGPLASLGGDAVYAVKSSLLQSSDTSSSLRRDELRDFGRNLHGAGDVALGRGLGAAWNSSAPAPTDSVAFGAGETAEVRLGWHVYGLDWLYKVGLLGVAAVLAVFAIAVARCRRELPAVEDVAVRSLMRSLAVITPVLLLFLFTNARLALFAGICAGAVSALTDRIQRSKRTARWPGASRTDVEPGGSGCASA